MSVKTGVVMKLAKIINYKIQTSLSSVFAKITSQFWSCDQKCDYNSSGFATQKNVAKYILNSIDLFDNT